MPNMNTLPAHERPLGLVIFQAGALWVVALVGYYLFLRIFSVPSIYTEQPVLLAAYYIFWIIIVFASFGELYKSSPIVERGWPAYILAMFAVSFVLTYLNVIVPYFPPINWTESLRPPTELLFATPWYFLPKSFEIFLQQLLVLAMVLSFAHHKYSLKATSTWCAVFFGGAHLLLVFVGNNLSYVATFTLAAVCASYIFPYYMLKVKNGFAISYLIHWSFYAVALVLAHTFFV